jgi:hypothetical protein
MALASPQLGPTVSDRFAVNAPDPTLRVNTGIEGGEVNRGLIGTIIGVLVIIILVIVILQLT